MLKNSNIGFGMTSQRTRLRLVTLLRKEGIKNEEVLKAIEKVPRHLFVDNAISHRAYENIPLPIGENQTISQPYTVARMTELLLEGMKKIRKKGTRILEIGCGCGYQTAVLSLLCENVFGIERIYNLYKKARHNLDSLNMHNVRCVHKDGKNGWEEKAPFDGIIISAATKELPTQLFSQLSPDGCMVLPYGDSDYQRLRLITCQNERKNVEDYDFVTFVPLLDGVKK